MDQALPPTPPSTATDPVADAEAALRAALLAGEDTAGPRAALDAARATAAALETQQRAARRDAARAASESAEAAAAAAATQAADELRAAIGRMAAIPEGVAAPTIDDARVSAAAAEVARLQAALDRDEPQRKRLRAEAGDLRDRAHGKRQQIAAIRARRLAGDEQSGDAAELHALEQDAAGLDGLAQEAAARLESLRLDTHVQQRLTQAQAALARAKDEAVLRSMGDRLRAIEAALLAGARDLRLAADACGVSAVAPFFAASQPLRHLANGGWL